MTPLPPVIVTGFVPKDGMISGKLETNGNSEEFFKRF